MVGAGTLSRNTGYPVVVRSIVKLQRLLPVTATLAILAASLLAAPVLAAEHPDMTGTWTLDPVKSDFGQMPSPSDLVFKIKAEGPEFTVNQTGGGQPEIELRFNTAGKEVKNELPGAHMTSTHVWDGATLVGQIHIAADDGTTLEFKDRINYSPDGKVMTLKRTISGPMGEGQMTLILNKTAAPAK